MTGYKWFLNQTKEMESRSGPGSAMSATSEIRQWLPATIRKYAIRSLADIPCGDCHWISDVCFGDVEYTGYDISEEMIALNRANFHEEFRLFDATREIPERADLILCRDLLVHLTLEDAMKVVGNFRKSGSKYVAFTTFPGVKNQELPQMVPGWGWRPLDMEAPPFSFGPPIYGVKEVVAGENQERWCRMYPL